MMKCNGVERLVIALLGFYFVFLFRYLCVFKIFTFISFPLHLCYAKTLRYLHCVKNSYCIFLIYLSLVRVIIPVLYIVKLFIGSLVWFIHGLLEVWHNLSYYGDISRIFVACYSPKPKGRNSLINMMFALKKLIKTS